VAIIAKLYQIESALRESRATAARRAETRRQQSTPVLEILMGELLALRQRPEVLPKSRLGRAIDYTLALWDRLLLFVDRGEIEIDNNSTENGIRPTAVGKKNWLFVGSETTGVAWFRRQCQDAGGCPRDGRGFSIRATVS
jgi:hypothetical protein